METTITPARRNKASKVSLFAGIVMLICAIITVVLSYLFLFVNQDFDTLAYGRDYCGSCAVRVLSIIVVMAISAILAIVAVLAGISSMEQIKKTGEAGRGSAIAGIVLGLSPLILIFLNILITIGINLVSLISLIANR